MSDAPPTTLEDLGWFSFAQAQAYTGLGSRTLRRYCAEGTVVAYRLGNQKLRFKRADLDALLVPVRGDGVA